MNDILVLGIGNPLLGDDGFGVEVIRRFRQQNGDCPDFCAPTGRHRQMVGDSTRMGLSPLPQKDRLPAEFLDGGTAGLCLLPYLEGRTHILVVDAIDFGGRPGEIVRLGAAEIPAYCELRLSEHQVTFREVLGLMDLMELKPRELLFVGVQPRSADWGDPLSPEVEAAIPAVLEVIEKQVEGWRGTSNLARS
jgi:hydrogenase maturation protease